MITDLDLPDAERFDVVPVLTEHAPGTPLLVVTERGSSADVERAVRSGATGYVLKSTDTETFFRALRSVAAGRPFLQAELGPFLYGPARAEADQRPFDLTDAELRLLDLLARGFTNRQAADAELVSLRTIESRRARLQEKLECAGHAALTRHAHQMGIGLNGWRTPPPTANGSGTAQWSTANLTSETHVVESAVAACIGESP